MGGANEKKNIGEYYYYWRYIYIYIAASLMYLQINKHVLYTLFRKQVGISGETRGLISSNIVAVVVYLNRRLGSYMGRPPKLVN